MVSLSRSSRTFNFTLVVRDNRPLIRTAIKMPIPHRCAVKELVFITFRLQGSLPTGRPSGKTLLCMDRLLDAGSGGPQYLQIPAIADGVAEAIQQGDERDYLLHTWIVMPNHVHLLVTPLVDVAELLQRFKTATARRANDLLRRTGQSFWQDENCVHVVRSSEEFHRIGNYIAQNPVRAGLAASAEEYKWSSVSIHGALKLVAQSG